jgi:hypothetical protein
MIADSAGDRGIGDLELEQPVAASPATGVFFQRPEPFCGMNAPLGSSSRQDLKLRRLLPFP